MDVSASWTNSMNGCNFYVLHKTNLNDSAWTTNTTPYAVTGAVTRISLTNDFPQAYFKLTDRKP